MGLGSITRRRLFVTGAVLCAIALVVATTAAPVDVLVGAPDTAGDVDVVGMLPHPEADGTYTSIDHDTGEVEIHLSPSNQQLLGEGMNANAVMDTGPLFIIRNLQTPDPNATADRSVTVWIGHDSPAVEFRTAEAGLPIEGDHSGPFATPIVLEPGEEVAVAMTVDTTEASQVELLHTITVYATFEPASTATAGGSEASGNPATQTDTPEPTPTTDAPPTPTETSSPTPTPTSMPTASATETATPETGSGGPSDDAEQPSELAGFNWPSSLWLLAIVLALVAALYGYRRIE